jgi:hypothetical protein
MLPPVALPSSLNRMRLRAPPASLETAVTAILPKAAARNRMLVADADAMCRKIDHEAHRRVR